MPRHSQLVFRDQRNSEEKAVLFECGEGIPFGWFVLFGGRNFWEPEQKIEERGGVSSERDPLITPLEVAEPRLRNALDAFQQNPHLWPFVNSLELLHKRVKVRSRKGFLQLEAGWIQGNEVVEFSKLAALMETLVFQVNQGNTDLEKFLKPFQGYAPWVPLQKQQDKTEAENVLRKMGKGIVSPAGLAMIMIGTPHGQWERFEEQVRELTYNVWADDFQFPPYPVAVKPSEVASPATDSSKREPTEKKSFFQRLFFKS
ncbi:MAG: hypothetical protein SFY68_09275 [Candidatus Sumerlaeia bacterium]|nr:hypothetical protein [Candidatus Sumerlaeia bacterium]